MSEQKPAVETKEGEAATTQSTEIKKEDGSVSTQPVDYQAELKAKTDEITRLTTERDNYKKGMLKAKGKLPDSGNPDDNELSLEEKIQVAVQEKYLETQLGKAQKEKDELLEKVLKENRELRTAYGNRAQISNGSQGASTEPTMEPKNQYFSDAQITELKKKGWDDQKIEMLRKNLLKAKR